MYYRVLQVDVSNQHDRQGRLYKPADVWGIKYLTFFQAEEPSETASLAMKRREEALSTARRWVEHAPGRMALVFNRRAGQIVGQYYRDIQGTLGFLTYSQAGILVEQAEPHLFGKGLLLYPPTGAGPAELTRVSAILEVERGPDAETTSGRLLHAMGVLRRSQLRGHAVRDVVWPADGPTVVPFFWYDGTSPPQSSPPRNGVERYFGLELIVDGLYVLDDECPHHFRVSGVVQIEVCGISGPLLRGSQELPLIPREPAPATGVGPAISRSGDGRLWEPRVSASCHSDDWRVEVPFFDATPWFAQASDEQIRCLQEEGYGGNYTADSVAELAADYDPQVQQLFTYLEIVNSKETVCGSECYVDRVEAEAWLSVHRPHLLAPAQEGAE